MTRKQLAVFFHSVIGSTVSNANVYFDSHDFQQNLHNWLNDSPLIDQEKMEIKSIRTLSRLPLERLRVEIRNIIVNISIYLEDGYYGFAGMTDFTSETLHHATDFREFIKLQNWFNGLVPDEFLSIQLDPSTGSPSAEYAAFLSGLKTWFH